MTVDEGRTIEWYDLESDLGETTNVLEQHPRVAADLARQYQSWNADNVDPSFPSFRVYHQLKKAFDEQMEFQPTPAADPQSR